MRLVNDLNEAAPRVAMLFVGAAGEAGIIDLATFDLVAASGAAELGEAIVSVRDPEVGHAPDEVVESPLYAIASHLRPGPYRVMYDSTSDTWVPVDAENYVADLRASYTPLVETVRTVLAERSDAERELDEQIEKASNDLGALTQLFAEGQVTREVWHAASVKLRAKVATLEAQRRTL